MSYQWPDENGNAVVLSDLSNEKLLLDTQRLVDAHRCTLNDALAQLADSPMFDPEAIHETRTMIFTGRVKAMIDECQKRGLSLNTDR